MIFKTDIRIERAWGTSIVRDCVRFLIEPVGPCVVACGETRGKSEPSWDTDCVFANAEAQACTQCVCEAGGVCSKAAELN
jgi:hypothetical protein